MKLKQFVKDWTLPVAIAVGTVVYLLFYLLPFLDGAGDTLGEVVDAIFPFMVFSTLFSTYCRIDFHQMRPHRWHIGVLVAQVALVALNVWINRNCFGRVCLRVSSVLLLRQLRWLLPRLAVTSIP